MFSLVLLISPCSIKSSIHEVVQSEYASVEKTSPNKAIQKSAQKCQTTFLQASKTNHKDVKSLLIPSFDFASTAFLESAYNEVVALEAVLDASSVKLYVLYSCLKISA